MPREPIDRAWGICANCGKKETRSETGICGTNLACRAAKKRVYYRMKPGIIRACNDRWLAKNPTFLSDRQTPELTAFQAMQARCYSTTSKDYPNYGGAGIGICDRWRTGEVGAGSDGFANFQTDMGPRPVDTEASEIAGHDVYAWLMRRDVSKDYSKDNCQWMNAADRSRIGTSAMAGFSLGGSSSGFKSAGLYY